MWLVWVDGVPVRPEQPLDLEDAVEHFRAQASLTLLDDAEVSVELRVVKP